ncbi:MAG: ribosome silencing factor [Cyclobacteriaceae bacterium]|nr:ribosome silencing factor [Cyclobacteriaceae bacterium]
MSKKEVPLSSDKLSQLIVKGMQEKKAIDIRVLDLRKVNNAVADFFIVCSGNSDTQILAIAESVEHLVYSIDKQKPWHKEGHNNKSWVLLDYVDVVVHIFSKEDREFYGIEDLWADAEITEIEDISVAI